jgi:hypothetical protein
MLSHFSLTAIVHGSSTVAGKNVSHHLNVSVIEALITPLDRKVMASKEGYI